MSQWLTPLKTAASVAPRPTHTCAGRPVVLWLQQRMGLNSFKANIRSIIRWVWFYKMLLNVCSYIWGWGPAVCPFIEYCWAFIVKPLQEVLSYGAKIKRSSLCILQQFVVSNWGDSPEGSRHNKCHEPVLPQNWSMHL